MRAVAGCPVPIVSAVGHEQDEPLCDLAADVRAATPTAAARLVVPDLDELRAGLERARQRLGDGTTRALERDRARSRGAASGSSPHPGSSSSVAARASTGRACGSRRSRPARPSPAGTRSCERKAPSSATRARSVGSPIDVELAAGGLGARVEEVRP